MLRKCPSTQCSELQRWTFWRARNRGGRSSETFPCSCSARGVVSLWVGRSASFSSASEEYLNFLSTSSPLEVNGQQLDPSPLFSTRRKGYCWHQSEVDSPISNRWRPSKYQHPWNGLWTPICIRLPSSSLWIRCTSPLIFRVTSSTLFQPNPDTETFNLDGLYQPSHLSFGDCYPMHVSPLMWSRNLSLNSLLME